MVTLFYLIAASFNVLWIIGFFGYQSDDFIHSLIINTGFLFFFIALILIMRVAHDRAKTISKIIKKSDGNIKISLKSISLVKEVLSYPIEFIRTPKLFDQNNKEIVFALIQSDKDKKESSHKPQLLNKNEREFNFELMELAKSEREFTIVPIELDHSDRESMIALIQQESPYYFENNYSKNNR
jgi:hypothetical protein